MGSNESDLIRAIKALGEKLGRPPMASDMREEGIYGDQAVRRHFSDFPTALTEAGYSETEMKKDYYKNVNTDELINEIQSISEKLGHPPNSVEIKEESKYSYTTYRDRFGDDIFEILSETGFDEKEIKENERNYGRTTRIPDSELIDDIKRIRAETGHRIDYNSLSEIGEYNPSTYHKHLGSIDELNELTDDD